MQLVILLLLVLVLIQFSVPIHKCWEQHTWASFHIFCMVPFCFFPGRDSLQKSMSYVITDIISTTFVCQL